MTSEEASKQIAEILEYFEDRIERETDPAFDKETAQKDADALRLALDVMSSTKDSSKDKVYVVTQDGYFNSYGCYGPEIYLVGVFTDKKEAEKAAPAERANITEIQLDKAFPPENTNFCPDCGCAMIEPQESGVTE